MSFPTSIRRAQLAVATLFLVLGFNFSTWASRIPALKSQLGLDSAEVGILLLSGGLGAIFSFPLTASLLQWLGSRKVCMLSAGLLPLNLLALGLAPDFRLAMLVMVVQGVLVSCLNVAMNAQGVKVETLGQQAIMSRLHAVFSLGGLLAALSASAIMAYTDRLIVHFFISAVVLYLALSSAMPHLIPEPPAEQNSITDHAEKSAHTPWALPDRTALWLGLIVLCGTVVENSMSDWSALYLKEVIHVSPELAPLGIAFVSAAMVLARWLGDGWRTRWGARQLLMSGGMLAGTGLLLALLIGGLIPTLVGFTLVGLGIAAVSPCAYTAAAKNGSFALAAVTTMGSIGSLAGPPLIGFIAHSSSYTWGMVVIGLAAWLVALGTRQVRWV